MTTEIDPSAGLSFQSLSWGDLFAGVNGELVYGDVDLYLTHLEAGTYSFTTNETMKLYELPIGTLGTPTRLTSGTTSLTLDGGDYLIGVGSSCLECIYKGASDLPYAFNMSQITPVPEPATSALMMISLLGAALVQRIKKKSKN